MRLPITSIGRLWWFWWLASCLMLTACTIEGGVAPPTTPGMLPQAAVTPTLPVTTTLTQTLATQPLTPSTGFHIGLLEAPSDLLPYYQDSSDQRITSPVAELLFPAPLLIVHNEYTTTGILQRVPSLENGDVEIQDVFIDASGNITTTTDVESSEIQPVQRIVVTYHWNPDLRWSDGITVTAHDSLFAYELAQQLPFGDDATRRLALLDHYEALDEHTTRATLKPDFIDPAYLRMVWPPLPRHILADIDPAELMERADVLVPVGYGPYMVEYRDEQTIRLKPNPYFPIPPSAEVLTISFFEDVAAMQHALRNGTLDVAVAHNVDATDIDRLKSDAQDRYIQMYTLPNQVWEHLDFNLDVPILQQSGVRHAIALATNRQQMVETLFRGYVPVLDSWIFPDHWAAAPPAQLSRYPHDPDHARRILDDMGMIDSNDDGIREYEGQPVALTLHTTQGMPRSAIAEQFQQDMATIGISVTVIPMPVDELFHSEGPLFRRTFQLAQFAWIADADPRGRELWSCESIPREANGWQGQNLSGWCFLDAHRAIIHATTTLDHHERQQAYLRHQELFTRELPMLPLFQRLTIVLAAPTLSGLAPDAIAPITWNTTTWSRE